MPVLLLPLLALAADDFQHCAAITDNSVRLACYDALAASQKAGADFGKAAPPPAENQVEARIAGHFDGWTRGQKITLDNGQVWKVVEDTQGYYPGVPDGAEVRVTTALFGGYVMEIKPIRVRLRVQRIS